MWDSKWQTRRKVLKSMGGASLALMGTGVTSAKKPNQDEESKGRIIKEESSKPILKQIIEDYGMHDEVTLETYRMGEDGNVSKEGESTINLERINSLRQARNDESIIQKIPNHLKYNIRGIENSRVYKDTGIKSKNFATIQSSGHNTNYSIAKKSALGNIQWKLTLYSTWSWDEEDRVIDSPYGFTFAHSEGNPYNWDGLQDSEITGLGTDEGHHRIEGKFTGYALSDKPYVEIGFKVRALTAEVEYKKAGKL